MRAFKDRRRPIVAIGLSLLLFPGCTWLPRFPTSRSSAPQPSQHSQAAQPTSTPVAQAGHSEPTAAAADPAATQQPRNRPTVSGSQLNLKPDETVLERALELSQKLTAADEEKKTLKARVDELTAALEEKEKRLQLANSEIQAATEEVIRSRTEMEILKQQLGTYRARASTLEQENLETLRSVIGALERLLEREQQPKQSEPGEGNESLPMREQP